MDAALVSVAQCIFSDQNLSRTNLSLLKGGTNNIIYMVTLSDGKKFVAKCYNKSNKGPKTRLNVEWDCLEFTSSIPNAPVPKPIHKSQDYQIGIFSCIPGRRLLQTEIKQAHLEQAADFVSLINSVKPLPSSIAWAIDSSKSIYDQLMLINKRISELQDIEVTDGTNTAKILLAVLSSWPILRQHLLSAAVPEQSCVYDEDRERICLSPSDFGFHNALVSNDELFFLDFEYAGLDDSEKMLADFLEQPLYFIDHSLERAFFERLSRNGVIKFDVNRVKLQRKLSAFKWICILLKRRFKDPELEKSVCETRDDLIRNYYESHFDNSASI